MENEIIVCIPGTWEDRAKLVEAIVVSTRGEFMCAGMILAHPKGNDHVELEFQEADEQMADAFYHAGQGNVSDATLDDIARHRSVVYLRFPSDITTQRARIVKYTEVLSRCGGIAVKLETSGIAHEWDRWFASLRSDNPFEVYCASVVLVGDERYYYSCGMQNFGLPDAQISNSLDAPEAADLMNQFNYWQVVERPALQAGHTFSLTADGPPFRLELLGDERHSPDDLYHNPNGVWELRRA